MQIKTRMRYYFIPISMVIIQNTHTQQQQKIGAGEDVRNQHPWALLIHRKAGEASMKNNMTTPQRN